MPLHDLTLEGHLSESLAMSQSVAAQLAATDESIQAVEREVVGQQMRHSALQRLDGTDMYCEVAFKY
eukprot:2384988-Amphidinium_carterae.1